MVSWSLSLSPSHPPGNETEISYFNKSDYDKYLKNPQLLWWHPAVAMVTPTVAMVTLQLLWWPPNIAIFKLSNPNSHFFVILLCTFRIVPDCTPSSAYQYSTPSIVRTIVRPRWIDQWKITTNLAIFHVIITGTHFNQLHTKYACYTWNLESWDARESTLSKKHLASWMAYSNTGVGGWLDPLILKRHVCRSKPCPKIQPPLFP